MYLLKGEVNSVNEEHQEIVRDFNLEKKLVYKTSSRPAFMNLKDHKPTFRNSPEIRLLNPQKPEVGRISKKILENICEHVIKATGLDLFKNSYEVIEWFKGKRIKKSAKYPPTFVIFDIKDYYNSVGETLLSDALDWASQYTTITAEQKGDPQVKTFIPLSQKQDLGKTNRIVQHCHGSL